MSLLNNLGTVNKYLLHFAVLLLLILLVADYPSEARIQLRHRLHPKIKQIALPLSLLHLDIPLKNQLLILPTFFPS